MNKVKEKFSSEGRMLLAHDCMSKPANQPSQVLNLRVMALCPAEDFLYLLWQESRWLLKIIHLTSRWLNSGEMNPTPPWHFPAERADLPQNISKEFHFGGFLTEAPLSHKISEGFFCLFFFNPCISSNCPEKERQCWILVPLLSLERCFKSLIKPDLVAVGTGILQINPPRLLREAVGCQVAKQGQHLLNAPGSLICHLLLHWTQVVSWGFASQYCSNMSSLGNDSYCGTGTLQATQKVGKNKFFPGEE